MVRAIEGTYFNGKVELNEHPPVEGSARVVVVFIPNGPSVPSTERAESLRLLSAEWQKERHLGGTPYNSRDELYDAAE